MLQQQTFDAVRVEVSDAIQCLFHWIGDCDYDELACLISELSNYRDKVVFVVEDGIVSHQVESSPYANGKVMRVQYVEAD